MHQSHHIPLHDAQRWAPTVGLSTGGTDQDSTVLSPRASEQKRESWGDWAAWHLPGGPVGPSSRWVATLYVEVGRMTYRVNINRDRAH